MMEISNETLARGLAKAIARDPRLVVLVNLVNNANKEVVLEEVILNHLPDVLAKDTPENKP